VKRSLILLVGLALDLALFAQGPGGPGGPPPGGGPPPRMTYDASQEITLQGTVTAVQVASQGPGPFVSFTFRSGDTTYQVMAGPQALFTAQQVVLAKDDTLTVVGVAQSGPGGSRFVARTLTKGDTVVTLLDSNGQPMGRP
jgi:hypothetical protein